MGLQVVLLPLSVAFHVAKFHYLKFLDLISIGDVVEALQIQNSLILLSFYHFKTKEVGRENNFE